MQAFPQSNKIFLCNVHCPTSTQLVTAYLRRRVLSDDPLDFGFICCLVFLKEVVCIRLRWRIGIWVIEKILDAQQDLLDRDCRLPAFLLVQNRQTDGAGRIDIGMEEWRNEFA